MFLGQWSDECFGLVQGIAVIGLTTNSIEDRHKVSNIDFEPSKSFSSFECCS